MGSTEGEAEGFSLGQGESIGVFVGAQVTAPKINPYTDRCRSAVALASL
jgi:hypothetical protein